VRSALIALGISPTAAGAASLSGEIGAHRFDQLFGAPPEQLQTASPTATLKLPNALIQYLESITIAPQHMLFRE